MPTAPRRIVLTVAAFAAAAMAAVAPAAHATVVARYAAATTGVVRDGNGTVFDNGAVVCDTVHNAGTGGVCLPFGGGDAVAVHDDVLGEDVAFQVCVDNNGDGLCGPSSPADPCPDQISFSHSDDGSFFNPVGPLPTGFLPGCTGGRWQGYVVFLCEGTHAVGAPHEHTALTGTATVSGSGEGSGNFCFAQLSSKAYFVQDEGNLTCGMASSNDGSGAVNQDPDGQIGQVAGGPWRTGAGDPVEVLCSIVATSSHLYPGLAGGRGSGVVPPTLMAFSVAPGTPVYLCTRAQWTDANGPHVYDFDADPGAPGSQCARAVETNNGSYRAFTVPQSVVP
ncbi:MAG TPA: hypothetical protein VFQ85_15820 [Mycobacteriales bacterium]|jgi:hypothetical protein|nr:hypothetical protein [Mycobacteriales bacterium]